MTHQRSLTGNVRRVADLCHTECDRLYTLLSEYFANTTRAQFAEDLAEKEWIILLCDEHTGQIQGFSTLMQLRTLVDEQPIVAFFSGDTIIHRAYRNETELPRLWSRHVFTLAETIHDARVYWFLISSGYKTYRFLPVFFREFYPTYTHPIPSAIKRILDTLGRLKFADAYDSAQGVVRLMQAAPLRNGVADISERRRKDPHVAFFVAANPGHANGDELACLTELTTTNLTAAGRRMVGR